jgi:hypothetical protein
MIQGHVGATPWRFKSSLRHFISVSYVFPHSQLGLYTTSFLSQNCPTSVPQKKLLVPGNARTYRSFCCIVQRQIASHRENVHSAWIHTALRLWRTDTMGSDRLLAAPDLHLSRAIPCHLPRSPLLFYPLSVPPMSQE